MAKKIIGGVGGILGLRKKKKAADDTPVMPVADDEEVRREKRRSLARQLSRGGRRSTILTDGGLGG
ncbi:hypothetical protein [Rhizorhabdus wittichii]|uniref:hypothetical protein n=1 Tax=Rhizorhabdus wittichii TaxID=160791 RepID=UPI0002F780D7|nr:hypothetical protein [Rhizorhabdus wittichii]